MSQAGCTEETPVRKSPSAGEKDGLRLAHGHPQIYTGRSFLFLQGPASLFFSALGAHLRSKGASTLRVNFCPGDKLYWRGPATSFRGSLAEAPDFFADLFHRYQITDLVLFGDTRANHQAPLSIARANGTRIHVFEEGYLRPYWITLERGGVNGYSGLPRDPDWYRRAAEILPSQVSPVSTRTSQTLRALQDMGFHLANTLAPVSHARYRTHRPRHPAKEYAGWAWRFGRMPFTKPVERAELSRLCSDKAPLFFFPLQLTGDSQITYHSPFADISRTIDAVIDSFSRYAPQDARLVIKNHPFDTGLDRHAAHVRRSAEASGVGHRVFFFESGHLPTIMDRADGTVVVNSTTGLAALGHDCPVKTLADPPYNIPGLTFQAQLDDFWSRGSPPDKQLYRDYRKVLLATTQVNGNFFTLDGIRLALENSEPLLGERSTLEILLQATLRP